MARVRPKPQPNEIEKYGLVWNYGTPALWIELQMLKRGGKFKPPGHHEFYGNGMLFHFKEVIKLCWPSLVFHEWNNLFVEHYLTHRTIVAIGPASSGKTNSAAVCVLADYFIHPDTTTILCCSTTRERLEDRIWGEIKKFHKEAKSLWGWLPGNMIEGRLRIVTDEKNDASDGRDFRNGLIGVPCFISGSLVDTPSGPKKIETLSVGDLVFNACGTGRITEKHERRTPELVRVVLADSRTIDCTPDHPFLTQRGWVKAVDLGTFDMVLSAHEAMSMLRWPSRAWLSESEILLSAMRGQATSSNLRTLRRDVLPCETQGRRKTYVEILQPGLFWSLGRIAQGMCVGFGRALQTLWHSDSPGSLQQKILLRSVQESSGETSVRTVREGVSVNQGIASQAQVAFLQQVLQEESDWSGLRKETSEANGLRTCGVETLSGVDCSVSHSHGSEAEGRASALVPDGFGIHQIEVGYRDRWGCPSHSSKTGERQAAHRNTIGTWVDRVEVLESASDPRFDKSAGGYLVHNLEVTGHPSYSVNGVVVHNCKKGTDYVGLGDFAGIKNKRVRLVGDELSLLPRVFVDAISNLDKNPDFKCVGLGNPKETTDALGVLAEPAAFLGGWDSGIDQEGVTKTWAIRRPDGICLQFPGTASPNLDGKLGIPLITQEQIDRDVAFYGKDSLWYTMFCQGAMPRGLGSRRVITRTLCLKNKAMEDPIWSSAQRLRIGALDAAYRGVGGDRCIFMHLEMGFEVTPPEEVSASAIIRQNAAADPKRQIIALVESMVVPLISSSTPLKQEEAEDQIVQFVMAQCLQRTIPPQNFFFDSGMRSTLVTSFSRLWSNLVNPIDFGGTGSERKVSDNIDVLCSNYYFNFVTELWHTARHIIQAGQFRGMTEEVMQEGCAREWTMVGGNKIQVEPKDKMKLKTGRSPDLFDCLVTGLEGARRLGFRIRHLSPTQQKRQETNWKRELREAAQKEWHGSALSYAK